MKKKSTKNMARSSDREFDAISLEVVRNKLDGIANEMELTLVRSAFSPIVKEALDASASLFTVYGETLAQAIATPAHLATLTPMVKKLLAEQPLAEMREDDIFILNDAYLGGTHLPDIAIMTPIFVDGRAIAISAAMTHHQDIGGMTPGSTPTNATEIFQEGIRIPLLKLGEDGAFNESVLKLLRLNVRFPEIFMGDLNAQIAACRIGGRRVAELATVFGSNELAAIFDELLNRAETMTRQALRTIPEGTYRYVDYLDNDGVDLDASVRIEVAVTVANGELECDFAGTSPQVRGPVNAVPSGAYAGACFAVRAITDPDNKIPNNGGCFRPIRLHLPPRSLVNPDAPAPVGCRSVTLKRIAGCILGALRQAVPELICADSASQLLIIHFGGTRSNGSNYITSQLLAGGSGASLRSDGVDFIETDVSNSMNIPFEAIEMDAPIRVHRAMLRPDSGGAGRHRGGLGVHIEFELLDGEVTMTYRGERQFWAPAGADGGMEGGRSSGQILRADGQIEVIPSKGVVRLHGGDRLIVETAGGGGYGKPTERPPGLIEADLLDGKISPGAADTVFGRSGAVAPVPIDASGRGANAGL